MWERVGVDTKAEGRRGSAEWRLERLCLDVGDIERTQWLRMSGGLAGEFSLCVWRMGSGSRCGRQ